MFKRIAFLFALLITAMSFVSTSYAWRPYAGDRLYGNFRKLDAKTYSYDVVWYENTNGEVASWINSDSSTRFPLTVKDLDGSLKTYNTKAEFIADIVVPAISEFNNKIPGYAFNYSGNTYGSNSSEWSVDDGLNKIQIYRKNSGDGSGAATWSSGLDEFGFHLYVGDPDSPTISTVSSKEWNIYAMRHEFLHCLWYSHKAEDTVGPTNSGNSYSFSYHRRGCNLTDGVGNLIFRELNEDSMAGIDETYNTGNWDLTLQGTVGDEYSTGYAEAYMVDDNTKRIVYQAPIDTTGFYRFRLKWDKVPSYFRVLVGNNKINEAYYGDYVRYNDVAYKCILDHTNQQPPNSTYWTVVNPIGGVSAIANNNSWNSTTNYKASQSIKWNYTNVYGRPSPGGPYVLTSGISMSRTANSLIDIESTSGIWMLYSYNN